MKQELTTAVEPRTEVELDPEIAAVLVGRLDTYHELCAQRKILDEAIGEVKGEIGMDVLTSGYEALEIAGSKVTHVRGLTTSLDQKKLIAQGVTLAQIERATVTKPKKPYWLVTKVEE